MRLELAKRYAQLNALNRIVRAGAARAARVIVAAGALPDFSERARASSGLRADPRVRVLKLGMLFPLDEEIVRAFAYGLEEILVIEEKGPFLERAGQGRPLRRPASRRVTRRARPRAASRSSRALACCPQT